MRAIRSLVVLGALASITTGLGLVSCAAVQRHEIVVRFEDLRQDIFMMELAVENKQWAEFDWNTMTVTISGRLIDARPALVGGGSPDMRSIRRTPVIDEINLRRQSRSDTLAAFRRRGSVGEGNDGLLQLRPGGAALSAADSEVLAGENADRRSLFAEFKRQYDAMEQPATIEEIGHVFAAARRGILKPGEWYVDEEGNWKRVEAE